MKTCHFLGLLPMLHLPGQGSSSFVSTPNIRALSCSKYTVQEDVFISSEVKTSNKTLHYQNLRAKTSFHLVHSNSRYLCVSLLRQLGLQAPIPHICHKHHKWCLWRKIMSCGEKFILNGQIVYFSGNILRFGKSCRF